MSLKEVITETENLKNKVKIAKNKINEKIVRGGGSTSKSLAEIPNNLESMINKNYKKVAIKEYNFLKMDRNGKIVLNLSFNPTFLIVTISQNNKSFSESTTAIQNLVFPNFDNQNKFSVFWQSGYTYNGNAIISNQTFEWKEINSTMNREIGYIRRIIAIE